jgi:hypothetical protein
MSLVEPGCYDAHHSCAFICARIVKDAVTDSSKGDHIEAFVVYDKRWNFGCSYISWQL